MHKPCRSPSTADNPDPTCVLMRCARAVCTHTQFSHEKQKKAEPTVGRGNYCSPSCTRNTLLSHARFGIDPPPPPPSRPILPALLASINFDSKYKRCCYRNSCHINAGAAAVTRFKHKNTEPLKEAIKLRTKSTR